MKTTVYFIRHAQSDHSFQGEDSRKPLTEKGLRDIHLVTDFLKEIEIDAVYSSHYQRCLQTLDHFVENRGFDVTTLEGLCERRAGVVTDLEGNPVCFPSEERKVFIKKQWADFTFKTQEGESLEEVQRRNIAAMEQIFSAEEGKTVVVGTHGIAFSTIMNYYDSSFHYDQFENIRLLLPFAAKAIFEDGKMLSYDITALAE